MFTLLASVSHKRKCAVINFLPVYTLAVPVPVYTLAVLVVISSPDSDVKTGRISNVHPSCEMLVFLMGNPRLTYFTAYHQFI